MAEALGILAQSNPSAGVLTTIYVVGAGKLHTAISTITICNRSSTTPTTYRISVAKAAAADDDKQYIAYDVEIQPNETKAFTIGITLSVSDALRVYATLATLSFNVFGDEVS